MNHVANQTRPGIVSGSVAGFQEPARIETEIEREVSRLREAEHSLEGAVNLIWEHLGRAGVLSPPVPAAENATAIQTPQSQLGNEIQARACGVLAQAQRVHDLMSALCL